MNDWYCYWGWSKAVADIYRQALEMCDGDESALNYGPSHIVWCDNNFERHNVEWCLALPFDDYRDRCSQTDLLAVKWSLEQLLELPDELLSPEPADYDGEDPQLWPPTVEMCKDFV